MVVDLINRIKEQTKLKNTQTFEIIIMIMLFPILKHQSKFKNYNKIVWKTIFGQNCCQEKQIDGDKEHCPLWFHR